MRADSRRLVISEGASEFLAVGELYELTKLASAVMLAALAV